MESVVNKRIFFRRYYRVLKWIILIAFIGKITDDVHSVIRAQTITNAVNLGFDLLLWSFLTSEFWYGYLSDAMSIKLIDNVIECSGGSTKKSISLSDIDTAKSTWKHGVVKLIKASKTWADPVIVIPEAIVDIDLRNQIISEYEKLGIAKSEIKG